MAYGTAARNGIGFVRTIRESAKDAGRMDVVAAADRCLAAYAEGRADYHAKRIVDRFSDRLDRSKGGEA